jgi:hypothetical protein
MDLNELSAPALAAAMKGGTETWGQWGSMRHHVPYVQPISGRRRRMCRCGCRKRATHGVFANGVCMGVGCELDARRFLKRFG